MKSLFDLFESKTSQKLVSALFMTYGFDAGLFEQHVLPAIFRLDTDFSENERRFRAELAENLLKAPVTVMVDGSGYQGGKTFLYDLINVRGCTFHPKCFLLLYPDSLRIIIGSCNITKPGMCYNAELFWHYDLTDGDTSGIAGMLKTLLNELTDFAVEQENSAFKHIQTYLDDFPESDIQDSFIHTSLDKKSFAEKLLELVREKPSKIKKLKIVSPFFESDTGKKLEGSMMGQLFDNLRPYMKENAKVEFCFPGIKAEDSGKWSVQTPLNLFKELERKLPGLSFYIISPLWPLEDGEEQQRSLHAKLVEINFDNGEWLYLVGSPNFTSAAMNSKAANLKNVEVGVFETSKNKLEFPPKLEKVRLSDLLVDEREETETNQPIIFIEKADLDLMGKTPCLKLTVEVGKAVYPFTVTYQNKLIYSAQKPQAELIINDFKLGHDQDLLVTYLSTSFAVPINVIQKYIAAQNDLGFDFQPGINDILAYYSGRYRSTEEIIASKKAAGTTGDYENQIVLEGFRNNLNLFFKALDGIKQCLEKPVWSEDGFKYEIHSPLGLKRLVDLFEKEYMDGKLAPEEAFFYMIETSAMLSNLQFQPDLFDAKAKQSLLQEISKGLSKILISMYDDASGDIKKQYKVMLREYGLGRLIS